MSLSTLTLAELKNYQDDARKIGEDLGVVTRDLSDTELIRFGRAFERQFILTLPTRQLVDVYRRHIKEALLGAMIAKEQMDAEIDGEQPAANKIGGPLPIRACWLGIGDDWEDIYSIYNGAQGYWSVGSPQNWIHSGTQLMGGTAGNPVRIGRNAVHVVFGISSIHPSPKLEAVQLTLDGRVKPLIQCHWAQKSYPGAPRPVKELDSCYIFNRNKTVLAKVFFSDSFGGNVDYVVDFPKLEGVSFVAERVLRLLDPDKVARTIVGADYDIIYTT